MNEVWKVGTLLVWLAAVAPMAEAAEHWVPMFPNADSERQGFLRIINHSKIAGFAIVDPCDDIGRCGRISLTIDADETVHFNSHDLEMGNEDKGLSGGVGSGTGDWRLLLRSTLNLEVLAYVRTQDGFMTAMHDVVEREEDGHYRVATFNPGRNEMQASLLRLLNPNRRTVEVAITGIDDKGLPSESVRVSLRGFSTRTITVQDLEAGGEGLEGALGEGAGKWQLIVEPSVEGVVDAMPSVFVMSLLQSPTGHLTNLSTAPSSRRRGTVAVPLFPAAGDSSGRQGFVRVINHSAQAGEVVVAAHDDTGRDHGSVSLELEPNETAHFNSDDLEFGNEAKGLSGGIGSGEGNWRMELSSTLDIEVLSYIRTSDGFLTSMHDVVPRGGSRYEVAVFNPGSNSNQESRLRLTNPGEAEAEVTITGIDGLRGSPGTEIRVSVPAGASRTLTASELESGGMGFDGELGDGDGKWQLRLESTETILVMSLLDSPTGHLTNLSTAPGRLPYADEFPDSPLTHIRDDNALVMSASEDLTRNNPSSGFYSRAFYEWFTDDFDFLLLLSNLNSFQEGTSSYVGRHQPVMNDTSGIGREIFFDNTYGSAGKLRGVIHFSYNRALLYGPSLHELLHTWSNYTVATGVRYHWGFSSAHGQLGGFPRAELIVHGNGRYSAGSFGTVSNGGNLLPFSPIELYQAGFVAPSEVPDLWVAADGEWLVENGRYVTTEEGHSVFTAKDVVDYSIDDLVAAHGHREPNHSAAQRHFRAAVILLINDRYPLLEAQVAMVSEHAAILGHDGPDEHRQYNFHEATGGRGSLAFDGLPGFRKQEGEAARLPESYGNPPSPHFCRPSPDGRGWVHFEPALVGERGPIAR